MATIKIITDTTYSTFAPLNLFLDYSIIISQILIYFKKAMIYNKFAKIYKRSKRMENG